MGINSIGQSPFTGPLMVKDCVKGCRVDIDTKDIRSIEEYETDIAIKTKDKLIVTSPPKTCSPKDYYQLLISCYTAACQKDNVAIEVPSDRNFYWKNDYNSAL